MFVPFTVTVKSLVQLVKAFTVSPQYSLRIISFALKVAVSVTSVSFAGALTTPFTGFVKSILVASSTLITVGSEDVQVICDHA